VRRARASIALRQALALEILGDHQGEDGIFVQIQFAAKQGTGVRPSCGIEAMQIDTVDDGE